MTQASEVLREYANRLFNISRTAEAAMWEIADAHMGLLSIGASNARGSWETPSRSLKVWWTCVSKNWLPRR
jgi:hypothetical protein